MTLSDKEIIKKKLRNLHIMTQEEIKLRNFEQLTDAIHDIVNVLCYLFEKLEEVEN